MAWPYADRKIHSTYVILKLQADFFNFSFTHCTELKIRSKLNYNYARDKSDLNKTTNVKFKVNAAKSVAIRSTCP